MFNDDITEFTMIDVDRIDLVGVPANGVPRPLLAKSSAMFTETKGTKGTDKLERRLRKALGVDMSGGATTAASRQSDGDLARLIRRSGAQTRANAEGNRRLIRQVFKAYDRRVIEANAGVAVATAGNKFDLTRAIEERRAAYSSRLVAKLIIAERTGANKGQYPNSVALFGKGAACTTHSIGDDPQVKGV